MMMIESTLKSDNKKWLIIFQMSNQNDCKNGKY